MSMSAEEWRRFNAARTVAGWLPIATAPRDGTYILLAGPSGYGTTPLRVHVGRWATTYRSNRWLTHSDDDFTDDGEAPTYWMPPPCITGADLMPNHVINEVVFRDLSDTLVDKIASRTVDRLTKHVDFSILLPIPINCWMGSVSMADERAFKNTALDWCTQNWGTKWNAYGAHNGVEHTPSALTLRFDTAWRPPYGWLAALLNTFHLSFQHNWLSDGEAQSYAGQFVYQPGHAMGDFDWREAPAPPDLRAHLHLLRWGVASFEETA